MPPLRVGNTKEGGGSERLQNFLTFPQLGLNPALAQLSPEGPLGHALQCASYTGRPQPTPGEAEIKLFSVHLLPTGTAEQALPSRRTARRAPGVPSRAHHLPAPSLPLLTGSGLEGVPPPPPPPPIARAAGPHPDHTTTFLSLGLLI